VRGGGPIAGAVTAAKIRPSGAKHQSPASTSGPRAAAGRAAPVAASQKPRWRSAVWAARTAPSGEKLIGDTAPVRVGLSRSAVGGERGHVAAQQLHLGAALQPERAVR